MKFLHLADLHLGRSFPYRLDRRRIEGREDRFKILERAIDYCNKHGIDYLILAGDIVEESMFKRSDLHRLLDQFRQLQSTKVLYLFGNHDFRWGRYLIETEDVPRHVYFFNDHEFTYLDDDNYGVRFVGQSWNERKYNAQLNTEEIEFREKFQHILIHHGNVNTREYFSLNTEDKNLKKFDYVAMGHIHRPFHDDNLYMPGTPAPLNYGDVHPGTAILGTYNGSWRFQPIRPSDQRIQEVKIDLTGQPSTSSIVKNLVQRGVDHSIFYITWTGKLEDLDYLVALEDLLLRQEIEFKSVNETTTALDLESLRNKNQDNLLGKFLAYMNENREMEQHDEILELGVQALLGDVHD